MTATMSKRYAKKTTDYNSYLFKLTSDEILSQ
jgi:hypothetical protein